MRAGRRRRVAAAAAADGHARASRSGHASPSRRTSLSGRSPEVRGGLVSGLPQGRRDSNPQPPVLETGALPIELLPFGGRTDPTVAATDAGHASAGVRRPPDRRVYGVGPPQVEPRAHRDAPVAVDTSPCCGARMSAMTDPAFTGLASAPRPARVSARIGAIAESATLAVDAKAKALKARRPPGDRLRRRRARLPDPRLHRRGRRRGLPRPAQPPLHPRRRAARAAGGDRREDRARLRATRSRPPAGAGHQRRQAGRLRGVRHAARPGRRGAAAGAVLDHLPRVDPARRRRAGRGGRRRDAGYRVTVEQLEAARTDRTKVLLFCSPSNPTGAVYSRERGRARSAAGPSSTGSGSSPTRSTSTSSTATRSSPRCRSLVPELRRHVRRRQRRRQDVRDDRLAGGLDDRPARRRQGRDQPAVARDLQRRQRVPACRAGRGLRRPVRGRDDARRPSTGAGSTIVRDAQRDRRRRRARSPRARSTPTRR